MSPLLPFQVFIGQNFVRITYFREVTSPLVVQLWPVVLEKVEVMSAPGGTRRSSHLIEAAEPDSFGPEEVNQGLENAAVGSLEIAGQFFGRKLPGGIEQPARRPDTVFPMLLQCFRRDEHGD